MSDRILPPLAARALVGRPERFEEVGERYVRHFVELCGLRPHESVLDVGCGIGRMALPLAGYLSSSARYEGFDVTLDGIDWCRDNITPRHPNFHFRHVDVHNTHYNPTGATEAAKFAFPYETGAFDFVFAASIFTHMLPAGVENYSNEIARVLRPGGRSLLTYFLLTEESLRLMDEGEMCPATNFVHDFGNFRATDASLPELVLAYRQEWVLGALERAGLGAQRIIYGWWPGRLEAREGQDIVVTAP